MKYSIEEVARLTEVSAHIRIPGLPVTEVGFDSRRLKSAAQVLFFALPGNSRNGENYVKQAWEKGVRNFVVSLHFEISVLPEANFLQTENPLKALQKLAALHRKTFTGPVVGITGSNGKTVVKEWLYHLLKYDFEIARSPRSYNSGLGVAISLLGIEPQHNMAIIEAGISQPGEMTVLENMIKPSLGIITHLGAAHDAQFTGRQQKADEKVLLFEDCDVLVYPCDSAEIKYAVDKLRARKPLLKTITWGKKEGASYRILHVKKTAGASEITYYHRGTEHVFIIPFTDEASVENAMSCLCTLAAFERWDSAHTDLFLRLPGLENRLSFFEGKNNNYIVNDSYSNDTDSLQVALDFFQRQQPGKPHLVVLSDLEQSDANKEILYAKVASILRENNCRELITVGPELQQYKHVFQGFTVHSFSNTPVLLQADTLEKINGKAILIKGARSFQLEKVAARLRRQMHQTVLEIDLNALRNNFTHFRSLLKPGTRMMAMVKAFGYGSGSFEAARTLQFAGAEYLAVAYTDEGVALRNAGIQIPVMVMNCGIEDAPALYEYHLEPVLFNLEGIHAFGQSGYALNVHIELDTGMHRLGFDKEDVEQAFRNFPESLHIVSVFSHLSASEDEQHDAFTLIQLQRFKEQCDQIQAALGKPFLRHIANTGAILRFPQAHMDMVRLGIGLYGTDPTGIVNPNLEVVATLKTQISQLRHVPAGESVGYARKAITDHDRVIATLPIGYADGLWRRLGNGAGTVNIHGQSAHFVGNICMDMCMVDVTGIPCLEGDEAEIFGRHQRVETLAEQCGTIPYEILTAVSQRVRREYVGEN
ncbi:MAG: bifunctional UDP-N-acetylmuramoyl-tripeptide:D-alanyl-D-alanine ligase/alanine racemase [Bacteroidetes bacterium]|nr:bifunctional UDP-N-acetylmuramoyl-tripeptide:D-alanyl-D-alanine ligase/alanine racemase [Bacteroidota bacterium]